jgi:hypothetical protein
MSERRRERGRRRAAGTIAIVVALVLGGCSLWPSRMTDAEKADELSMGYVSLRQLLEDEGKVDKLLLVKSVDAPTEQLIDEIASLSAHAGDQLEELSALDPPVAIDRPAGLPIVEQATRDSIASQTALDLVFSEDTFETRLLLSQGQALRYARFLTEALASRDPNESRQTWLRALARRYEEIYKRLIERLTVQPAAPEADADKGG